MKRLYPNQCLSPSELGLTKEQLDRVVLDNAQFGGINVSYKNERIIESLWLSSAGRRFVENRKVFKRFCRFLVKNYKWLISSITSMLGVLVICSSCNHKLEEDEIWRDKVTLNDGSYIFVYHSHNCKHKKPLFLCREKIIDFRKLKYSVYDYCISERDAEMLDAISRRNIGCFEEYAYDDVGGDMYFKSMDVFDDSHRDFYTVYFSRKSDGELILQKEPIEMFMLK